MKAEKGLKRFTRLPSSSRLLLCCIPLMTIIYFIILIYEDGTVPRLSKFSFEKNCRQRDILDGPSDQDDKCLLDIIKDEYLVPPSALPYNFTKNHQRANYIGDAYINHYLRPQRNTGFFIECGANDGEFLSNTVSLEVNHGWKGLLIEASTLQFNILKSKNRKVWSINACLSPYPYATKLTFFYSPFNSGVSGLIRRESFGSVVPQPVVCFPLFSILAAMDVKVVDYFSLDIEGKELDVLKTIPFDKVLIKMLQVEHWTVPGGLKAVKDFLESKGYIFLGEIEDDLTRDGIYIHQSLITS